MKLYTDTIILDKLREIEQCRSTYSERDLELSPYFPLECHSFKSAMLAKGSSRIISEFRRGNKANSDLSKEDLMSFLVEAKAHKAAAISIHTDAKLYGGDGEDIVFARKNCQLPLIRRELILDEFQIIESKAMGADVIVLAASVLSAFEIERFAAIAQTLGMESILEVNNEEELKRSLALNPHIEFVSIPDGAEDIVESNYPQYLYISF